jgi:chromosome segregation ATPase
MEWLRDHMRDHVSKDGDVAASTLDLVQQAADTIKVSEDRVADTEARARIIINQAKEELRLAEKLYQTSEAARIAAEAEAKDAKQKLIEARKVLQLAETRIEEVELKLSIIETAAEENETKLISMEHQLKLADARVAGAENERHLLEVRAKAAERRAGDAEDAFKRVQNAIRVLLSEREAASLVPREAAE